MILAEDRWKKMIVRIMQMTVCLTMIIAGINSLDHFANEDMMKNMMLQKVDMKYERSEEILYNPYMGFAPAADYMEAVGENTLVYIQITFKELEPEEGIFDWATIEEKNHIDMWKQQGKHAVFRFVLDKPGKEEHMDIPEWLYQKTKDGEFYDISYGKGYAPNYENPILIKEHAKALKAIGEHFVKDDFLYYIEMGSLGHWGEWHVTQEADVPQIPGKEILENYVSQYNAAFPDTYILMRRPFEMVKKYGYGVYNDMAGEKESTREWLSWIENGGIYQEAIEPIVLSPVKGIWNILPVGGEFTSSIPMEELLQKNQSETIQLLEQSHMTFLGPKCPIANKENIMYPKEVAKISKYIGYRYGVSQATIGKNIWNSKLKVKLTLENYGVAPMYENWKVHLYLLNEKKENLLQDLEIPCDIKEIQGGSREVINADFAINDNKEKYQVAIAIVNPQNPTEKLKLDMKMNCLDGKYILTD